MASWEIDELLETLTGAKGDDTNINYQYVYFTLPIETFTRVVTVTISRFLDTCNGCIDFLANVVC